MKRETFWFALAMVFGVAAVVLACALVTEKQERAAAAAIYTRVIREYEHAAKERPGAPFTPPSVVAEPTGRVR